MPKLEHSIFKAPEIAKGLKLKGFFGILTARFIMCLFRLNRVNKYYDKCFNKDAVKFCDNCLKHNNIKIHVHDKDVHNIPDSGPAIILFNHPLGGIDALATLKTLAEIRPDVKFLANFLLTKIEPVAPYLLQVNPFETRKKAFSSLSGLKSMHSHIDKGGAVCIFPSGEVSTKYNGSKIVEDREWQSNIIRFIQNANAPVISAFISGGNSNLFHLMGKINPALRTAMIPRELLINKNQTLYIRFSGQFNQKLIKSFERNYKHLGEVLRAKTYCLEDEYILNPKQKVNTDNYQKIIDPINKQTLSSEIESIKKSDLLFQTDNYMCFFSDTQTIPNIFNEIARLREISFREVGEGTGKESDFDKYDTYYKHLFLWDENDGAIVGAYRIGMGTDILSDKGFEGFYMNSLFSFTNDFKPYLGKSMEMGRSFVAPDYQRKALPLFLLWKGIYHVTQKYQDYKYLLGPASISNLYSKNAKALIVEYLKRNHIWSELTPMVDCRNPFNYKLTNHHKILLEHFNSDLSHTDRLIRDIDTNHMGMPILIKKYLSLGGRIVDFNVDPDFNYSIDGLVILDIDVVSEEVIKSYNK